MIERHLSYELLNAPAQKQEAQWLFSRHSTDFKLLSADENDEMYSTLSARVQNFAWLEDGKREEKNLTLHLRYGFMRISLYGIVEAEYSSAAKGERRNHLESIFLLPSGWELHLNQIVRQDLVSGKVRLTHELWFKPGHRRSFRWIIIAKALKWSLEKSLLS